MTEKQKLIYPHIEELNYSIPAAVALIAVGSVSVWLGVTHANPTWIYMGALIIGMDSFILGSGLEALLDTRVKPWKQIQKVLYGAR
jgi:hypothetical protein